MICEQDFLIYHHHLCCCYCPWCCCHLYVVIIFVVVVTILVVAVVYYRCCCCHHLWCCCFSPCCCHFFLIMCCCFFLLLLLLLLLSLLLLLVFLLLFPSSFLLFSCAVCFSSASLHLQKKLQNCHLAQTAPLIPANKMLQREAKSKKSWQFSSNFMNISQDKYFWRKHSNTAQYISTQSFSSILLLLSFFLYLFIHT